MKVWICIAYDPLPGIDLTTRLLRYGTLANRLAGCGHSVVLWTSTFDHVRKRQRFDTDRSVDVNENLRIELLNAPAYPRNACWARVQHNRALAARFRNRAMAFNRPDLIVAAIPCLELAEAAADYATLNKIPLNVDIQDIWPEAYVSLLPPAFRGVGRFIFQLEFRRLRRILDSSDGLTAVSREYLGWAQSHRSSLGENYRVFHLGYNMPSASVLAGAKSRSSGFLSRLGLPADRTIATFLGQFGASYDIETIVESARILERERLPLHFALAGSGDKYANVQRLAKDLSSVTLTGWLEYEETLTLLQNSHIGLAAYSRQAPQSLPYKPFEYMAFGLPIVSSLRGELRQIIQEGGLGGSYQSGDPASLAAALRDLTSHPGRLAAAGRSAREAYIRDFDTDRIIQRFVEYLQQLGPSAS